MVSVVVGGGAIVVVVCEGGRSGGGGGGGGGLAGAWTVTGGTITGAGGRFRWQEQQAAEAHSAIAAN